MKRLLTVLTLSAGLAVTVTAHADTFTFNLAGSGGNAASGFFSGSGTFTASPDTAAGSPAGAYLITAITGTDVDSFITPGDFDNDDDLIYPTSSTFVDASGVAFVDQTVDGVYDVDIYSSGGGYDAYVEELGDTSGITVPVTFTVASTTVTPEPSSILLLATGLLGVVFLARRRFLPACEPIAS